MPRKARVYADDIAPGNHRRSTAGASDLLDRYDFDDYAPCLIASQDLAINVAGRSCFGVSYGTYGVAYSHVLWDVFWNEEYQGTVDQQYDCGDVSVY